MNVPFPNADLPSKSRGGRELFDAEGLFDEDFFYSAPPPSGPGTVFNVWNGAAWVESTLQRWTGSAWEAVTIKRWTGAAWVDI